MCYLFCIDCIHFKIVLPDMRAVRGRPLSRTYFAVPFVSVCKQVGLVKSFGRAIFCGNSL